MKRYTLTHASQPSISEGEAEVVYMCLEPYGSIHSLEELIAEAVARKLQSHFKRQGSTTVHKSLLYHLNRFKKAGILREVGETDI